MSTEETKPVALTIEDLKAHTTRDDVYLLVSGKGAVEIFPLGCLRSHRVSRFWCRRIMDVNSFTFPMHSLQCLKIPG